MPSAVRRLAPRWGSSVAILALAVWLGGMLALGAIAAPVVFSIVPAPASADAMTVVFRRFDRVAMGCAVVVLAVEAMHARLRASIERLDVVRVAMAVVAGGLALVEGVWISPRIEALHRAGAIRGLGAMGLELDSVHHVAETLGKAEVLLAMALILAYVVTAARPVV